MTYDKALLAHLESALSDAVNVTMEKNPSNPILFLANYLIRKEVAKKAVAGDNVPQRVLTTFRSFDASGDDMLTLRELESALRDLFPDPKAHALAAVPALFEEHAVEMLSEPGLTLQAFNQLYGAFLFKNFDKNGDGSLGPSEAAKALEFMGPVRLGIRAAMAKVRSFDVNGDKLVDPTEFYAMYSALMSQGDALASEAAILAGDNVPSRVAELFRKSDSNRDGLVTLDELKASVVEFFPTLPTYATAQLPTLFDEYSSSRLAEPRLTLQRFNQLYATFLFKHFDAGDSGSLSLPEAARALEFLGPARYSVPEAIAAACSYDINDDAKIDPYEFQLMYTALMAD